MAGGSRFVAMEVAIFATCRTCVQSPFPRHLVRAFAVCRPAVPSDDPAGLELLRRNRPLCKPEQVVDLPLMRARKFQVQRFGYMSQGRHWACRGRPDDQALSRSVLSAARMALIATGLIGTRGAKKLRSASSSPVCSAISRAAAGPQ